MSVINQMLLELDRRRASVPERSDLPSDVLPLPPVERRLIVPMLAAGTALVLLAAVAGAAWLQGTRLAPHDNSAPAAVQSPRPDPTATPESAPMHLTPQGQALGGQTDPPLPMRTSSDQERPAGDTLPRSHDRNRNAPRAPDSEKAAHGVAQPLVKRTTIAVSARQEPDEPARQTKRVTPAAVEPAKDTLEDAKKSRIDKQLRSAVPREHAGTGTERVPPTSSVEAVAHVQRAQADDAASPAASIHFARAQAERGEVRAALETLQSNAAAGAGNAEYRGLHAAVLQRASRHAEAIEEYGAALRLVPSASVWWMGLGLSLEAVGLMREARDAFLRARAGDVLAPELAAFVEQKIRQLP